MGPIKVLNTFFPSLELSFGQWTCCGSTDLPRRRESGSESGAPEALKTNPSFLSGGAEKRELKNIYVEVIFMTHSMSKAFKEDYPQDVQNFRKSSKDSQ